jgi:hypothetical protein
MTKILNFPQKTDSTFPSSDEEAQTHLTEVRQNYCDEISNDAMDAALSVIVNYGVYIKPVGSAVKDLVFLEEALKAILYRNKNLVHPFHDMIEKAIVMPDEERERLEELLKDQVDLV